MNSDGILVFWRHRLTILASVLILASVVFAYTKTQPKIYETSATLLIAQPTTAQTFDSVQAAQVVARTYGNVLTSSNFAGLVSDALGGMPTRDDLFKNVTAEPIAETQLLKITIEDTSPQRARQIADTYAKVFTSYVRTTLTPITRVSVTVANAATLPESPAKPRPKLYTALAALVGLALGFGLVLLRERFDRRVRTTDAVIALVDLPVLAEIPKRQRGTKTDTRFVEAFRVLRTNLLFVAPGDPVRTIAITSYASGEGKSTVTSDLALVSAATLETVVVVEADIQRPAQQLILRPDMTAPLLPGLTSRLTGVAALEDCMHRTRLGNVGLVTAGPPVPSLSGLLELPEGQAAMAELRASGDLVLFDCPPLAVGADAAALASRVDGVILVVDIEGATAEGVREAVRRLATVRARVLGIVVNRVAHDPATEYGYGYNRDTTG